MGESTANNQIVLLFDNYGTDSKKLRESFILSGVDIPAVVIDSDGFLPDGVISVYEYFLGDFKNRNDLKGEPLYYNQITVPDYWEISGTNSSGKVHDLTHERGRIFYTEPRHKRLVKVVDWLDDKGIVRSSDHYNRYGALYARTIFNVKGQKVNKSYFDADGKEVIHENFVTNDIILNETENGVDTVRMFHGKVDFILYFMQKSGFANRSVYYNTLSTPFFVSLRMDPTHKGDILFWQEPKRNDIPGNMQVIFDGEAARTSKVLVQRRSAYDKLIALGANKEMTGNLGYVYPFEKENTHGKDVLICTNSDNVEKLEYLIQNLPGLHFHVAALTEMSSKLMAKESYANVTLYPGAKEKSIEKLMNQCDWYLDINHEGEIVSAVYRAFLHNHIILGFEETLHNRDYVMNENRFTIADVDQMIEKIKELMRDENKQNAVLQAQRQFAMSEEKEAYQRFL